MPDVAGYPTAPCSSSTSRTSIVTSRTSLHGTPGVGIQVHAQLVGMIDVVGRTGHGLMSRHARFAIHTRCAASAGAIITACRPLGNVIVAVCTHGGRCVGTRF